MTNKKSATSRFGNPLKRIPVETRLERIMTDVVHLTSELKGRLSEQNYLRLRSSALGLMLTHSNLSGMPSPDSNLTITMDEYDSLLIESKKMFLVDPDIGLPPRARVVCNNCFEQVPPFQMKKHASECHPA